MTDAKVIPISSARSARSVGFERVDEEAGEPALRCLACGEEGDLDGSWADECRRGHAPCPKCGKGVLRLRADGRPRKHTRCPNP